jgi:hypothetical protein
MPKEIRLIDSDRKSRTGPQPQSVFFTAQQASCDRPTHFLWQIPARLFGELDAFWGAELPSCDIPGLHNILFIRRPEYIARIKRRVVLILMLKHSLEHSEPQTPL